MNQRRSFVAIASLLATAFLLQPSDSFGVTGLSYLKIGAGARSVAMGDAVVSHVDDASANYWNPGALSFLPGTQAEVMHNESFQDVRYEFVSLTRKVHSRLGAGIALNGVWTDNLRAYNRSGEFEGNFGYYGLAVSTGLGFALSDRIGVGGAVEFLREAVDVYSTSGVAFNLGVQVREVLPRTHVGLAVLHLGSSLTYESEPFDLPMMIQGGVTHAIPVGSTSGRVLLAAEMRHTRDEDSQLLFGTEYRYQELASLQVGYRTGLDTQDVSLGVGLGRERIRGQYAFVPFSENLGDQHRISLLLAW